MKYLRTPRRFGCRQPRGPRAGMPRLQFAGPAIRARRPAPIRFRPARPRPPRCGCSGYRVAGSAAARSPAHPCAPAARRRPAAPGAAGCVEALRPLTEMQELSREIPAFFDGMAGERDELGPARGFGKVMGALIHHALDGQGSAAVPSLRPALRCRAEPAQATAGTPAVPVRRSASRPVPPAARCGRRRRAAAAPARRAGAA